MARNLVRLQTERLILRGINETDVIEIVEWRSDPEVYQYFKSPHKITVQEHFNWFNNSYLQNDKRMDWMCIEKGSGKKIGVFGLIIHEDEAEINYLLAPDARHKGYATEAIRSLMEFADSIHVPHVIAEIHKKNEPSVRLVRRLGFELEKAGEDFEIYGKSGG